MFCDRCGTSIPASATICPQCGHVLTSTSVLAGSPLVVGNAQNGPMEWLGEGWTLLTSNFWLFTLLGLISVLVDSAVPVILQGPLTLGLQWALLRQLLRGRAEINDGFIGFNYFVNALMVAVLSMVSIGLGLFLCIVPGLLAAAVLQFPYLLMIDRGIGFWPAMVASYELSKPRLGTLVVFVLLQICVIIAGVLLCVVGLFVAIPWIQAATVVAYRDLAGIRPETQARA